MSELSDAARVMGRKKTPKKIAAANANLVKARARLRDDDVRAKVRAAQRARRQREREERRHEGHPPVEGRHNRDHVGRTGS